MQEVSGWDVDGPTMASGSGREDFSRCENLCAAAEQLQAAVTLAPVESSAKLLAETQAACEKARRDAEVRRQLAGMTGRILYSTQEGDAYRIYRAPATLEAKSALLIDDGSQPVCRVAQQRGGFSQHAAEQPRNCAV